MASYRRINVNVRIDRATWFKLKSLSHANRVPVERATEALLQEALERLGIEVKPEDLNSTKVEGPEMVRS